MTLLRQDAEGPNAPRHVLTLTSRDPVTDPAAYRDACAVFWRAFRRTWGRSVEYCGFIEWTTGDGPRSGGFRRMHSHWLVKGLDATDLQAVETWASIEWRKLTGAWVVQLAELQSGGGVVGYLALHHEKLSQAPPAGWSGKRFRPSKGYFSRPVAELREIARLWLRERRWLLAGMSEGEMLAEYGKPAPRVVFQRTEAEKASETSLHLGPGRSFGSTLRDIREHEERLERRDGPLWWSWEEATVREDEYHRWRYAARLRHEADERRLRAEARVRARRLPRNAVG